MKPGLIKFRNTLLRYINESWAHLGAYVIPGNALFRQEFDDANFEHFGRLLIGANKDGKGVFLYPRIRRQVLSKTIKNFLLKMEERGAIVGLVHDAGDAYDIIVNDESQYKRKKRTYINDQKREVEPQTNAE